MDLLALIIASLALPAIVAGLLGGTLGYLAWGWLGALPGFLLGFLAGHWYARNVDDAPLSATAKGWWSLGLFIGGLTVLAIATR